MAHFDKLDDMLLAMKERNAKPRELKEHTPKKAKKKAKKDEVLQAD